MELKTYFAQDAAGNIISSAIVNVFLHGTTTLATGLTRADGTPLENPFAADGAGRIQFRAPDGYYDVQVSAGPGIIQTLTIQCVDYSGAKADADRAEAAADRADVSAEQVQNALNNITGINTNFEQNSREQWRRSLAEAGLTLVSGSFEEGATANSSTDAVWHIAVGQCYTWDSALPKVVPAGSTPETSGGIGLGAWVSVSSKLLRSQLEAQGGVNLVKGAVHAATANDDDTAFNSIVIRGDVYQYDSSVTISADGLSYSSGKLYLTRNGKSYKLLTKIGFFTWPGEYLSTLADAKSSLEAVMLSGRHIDLNGCTVTVSTLNMTKDVVNGTIKAAADVGTLINVNSCRLYNANVDCDNKAVRRIVYIRPGSVKGTVKKVEIFNSTGATNANGVFVDANNAQDFLVDDVFIHNLTSVGNGSQGDADGPCRGIIVGTALDPAPTASTVSSGEINNIRIRDLAPFEDCDGVVVQIYDALSVMLSAAKIRVKNIDTHNVRKRAVKIQANDVTVSNVYAYCDTQDTAMYSIVSMYGDNGYAVNINGRGRISNGIDCAYGFNKVSGLNLKTERTGSDTLAGIGAGLLINSGHVDASDIYSDGAEYVLAIRDALGATPYVKVSGLRGHGYSGVVRFQIRAGNSIGSVYIDDVSATSSATNKSAISVDITSNGVELVNVSNVKRLSQAFNGADINMSGAVTEAIFRDCILNAGSSTVGIAMATGKLTAENISASGKIYAVQAVQTTNAIINNIDGTIRLENTTNTMAGLYRGISSTGTNTGLLTLNYA